jgi:hypothetical protein
LGIIVSHLSEEVGLKITYRVTAVKLPVPKLALGTSNGYEGGEGTEDLHSILYILVVKLNKASCHILLPTWSQLLTLFKGILD